VDLNRGRQALFAALAALALIVAACGPSGGSASPAGSIGVSAPPATTGSSTEPSAGVSEGPTVAPSESSAASPSGGGQIGGTVTVIGVWGGSEQESFLAMVKPFEETTGIKVEYTGTRDLNAVLTTGVASGLLPDLAGFTPGLTAGFVESGALKPLDDVLDMATYKAETAPALTDLVTVDGKTFGVFIKAALKGLIWYNPKVYSGGAPTSFDALMQAPASGDTKRWCVGLESGAASGWPATDWIEDILIRQAGPEVYDKWVRGEQKWTSPEIKAAFETFGRVVADDNVFGGSNAVLTTNFGDAGNPLFTNPPGCEFHHQASFITDFFKKQGGAADGDFDFFPMPDINPQFSGAVSGVGDLFGMFNDTPQARALIAYLVTPEAQAIWVGRGGALSANSKVTNYPDDVSKRSAEILASAKIFRFDGSDLMPEAMNNAFWKAMLDFTKDQAKLDAILGELDDVQASAYGG